MTTSAQHPTPRPRPATSAWVDGYQETLDLITRNPGGFFNYHHHVGTLIAHAGIVARGGVYRVKLADFELERNRGAIAAFEQALHLSAEGVGWRRESEALERERERRALELADAGTELELEQDPPHSAAGGSYRVPELPPRDGYYCCELCGHVVLAPRDTPRCESCRANGTWLSFFDTCLEAEDRSEHVLERRGR